MEESVSSALFHLCFKKCLFDLHRKRNSLRRPQQLSERLTIPTTAGSVLITVPDEQVTVDGTTKIFQDKGDSGKAVYRHFCGVCGT